jgi:hypothetical protein
VDSSHNKKINKNKFMTLWFDGNSVRVENESNQASYVLWPELIILLMNM